MLLLFFEGSSAILIGTQEPKHKLTQVGNKMKAKLVKNQHKYVHLDSLWRSDSSNHLQTCS
jgi:hypothetical protein